MMQKKNKTQMALVRRLAVIKGQIEGLMGMLEANEDCLRILVQMKAAKAGLAKVGALFVEEYMAKCIESGGKTKQKDQFRKILTEIVRF